ncbi:MAG TPA: DUF1127 domain-containing protein [Candidatus Competibacteraceae bacterium]|nr:DUF1127 domain-containing protein [Candidatus Competibacteraceae bacterium]
MRKSASTCTTAMLPRLSVSAAAHPSLLSRWRALLHTWRQRRALRRKLAELDDHLLHDIGWSAEAAAVESRKPFWRP